MSDSMTAAEFVASRATATTNKYGAKRTTVDGIEFASRAEARRYGELKLMQQAGEIASLELQPKFPLSVEGVKVGTYIGDFLYFDIVNRRTVLEDVKGAATPVYRLKKKLVLAIYGITIEEIT